MRNVIENNYESTHFILLYITFTQHYRLATCNMEKNEFLEKNIFTDLTNINDASNKDPAHYFSEADFEKLLERVAYFGIGIYEIKTSLKGKSFDVAGHLDHKKKATDPRWYNKAFLTLKKRQEGLAYTATYKLSKNLLERKEVSTKKD